MTQLNFDRNIVEKPAHYKGEDYLVREDGSVYRLPKANTRMRKWDEKWTQGQKSWDGYMRIGNAQIHRIVAIAFHGEAPSDFHVVDHIDTDKANNRPENLRWVTQQENINNPISKKKIERYYGSIPEMIDHHRQFGDKNTKASLASGAAQKNWRTPSHFPICPQIKVEGIENVTQNQVNADLLQLYWAQLEFGTIFSQCKHGVSVTVDTSISEDNSFISVICNLPNQWEFNWSLAKIFVSKNLFVHESLGLFTDLRGAMREKAKIHGEDINDSFDDLL